MHFFDEKKNIVWYFRLFICFKMKHIIGFVFLARHLPQLFCKTVAESRRKLELEALKSQPPS